jgi:glycosyltransferase involved in cell wall biosynthesis
VQEIARDAHTGGHGTWRYRLQIRILPLFTTPAWVLSTDIPSYRQQLRSLVRSWEPDIVQIEYHVMAQYIGELHSCYAPRVMTQYEPGVTAAGDVARGMHGLDRILGRMEAAAWARYEQNAMSHVDAVVVFTEYDRQALAPLAGAVPIERIPLGVAVPPKSLNPCGGLTPTVLFVGNFGHGPNVDAALWLMRSIFPLVSRTRPDARLIVVGPDPPHEITALSGGTMMVTGAVPSVLPFLDDANVVVAPLRRGGGMRVKVMEALAAGKAVVASPLAAAGLDVRHGQELLLAERDHEFASLIVNLLNDPTERRRVAESARSWAVANLDWRGPVAAYEALHDRLLAGGNRRRVP